MDKYPLLRQQVLKTTTHGHPDGLGIYIDEIDEALFKEVELLIDSNTTIREYRLEVDKRSAGFFYLLVIVTRNSPGVALGIVNALL